MHTLRRLLTALVVISLAPAMLAAQQQATVTGRVTSEAGQPLVGASVGIQSLNVGTLTRSDGTYTLNVPASRLGSGRSVQVTANILGHRAQSQAVQLSPGGTATLNFQLQTDVLQLEGIVATGAGTTTTRERLGVSVSSVRGEQLTQVATPNVVSALAGKAAGVEIRSAAGDPGASTNIRIRGAKSITGSGQPLFVVDGVPISNDQDQLPSSNRTGGSVGLSGTVVPNRASDINANDIASIEILKGAAAAAIYGARAANGVVLITTKRGQPGQTRFNLSSSVTTDQVNKAVPLQMTYGQGTAGQPRTGNAAIQSWGAPVTGEKYDHWGELFEDGRMYDTNLSISGGSERTTYYLSLGRTDHNGTIVGSNDFYDKSTARLKGSHRLTENFNVTGNFAFTQAKGGFVNKGSNVSGLLLGGLRTPIDFNNLPWKTAEGFHRAYRNPSPTALRQSPSYDNPFWVIYENQVRSDLSRAYGNVALDYQPTEWLNVQYTLGHDFTSDERDDMLPPGNSTTVAGYLGRAEFRNQTLDHNAIANLKHGFGDNFQSTLTLGYNRSSRNYRRFFVEGTNQVVPNLWQLDNFVTRLPDEYGEKVHAESFFGQAQLDLFDQLFLTGALRNDGFSTFAESQKRHWFPKFSAAWDVGRLVHLDAADNPILSFVKLRGAWGRAGNEPPVYGTIGGYTAEDMADAGWGSIYKSVYQGRGGLRSYTVKGQPELGPEITTETEFGLDASFLGDRATLGATYYNSLTEGATFYFPLAPSSGFSQQLRNAADIRNRGVELTLDLRPVTARNFGWEINGNWTRNRNKVLSLGPDAPQYVTINGSFAGSLGRAWTGYPLGVLSGQDFYRCRPDETQPANVTAACAGQEAGTLFIDADGFPVADPAERVIMNPEADWTAGLRNTVTLLGNVQISALLDVRHGGEVWNGTRGSLYTFGTHKDTEVRASCNATFRPNSATGCTGNELVFGQTIFANEKVAGPGAGKAVPIGENWYTGNGGNFGPVARQFVEDGGYVKLREVAVNYSVPSRMARSFGLSGLDLRLAARNLATWTKYTGIDPETNLSGNSTVVQGVDYFNNPQTRSLILTVNLNR